MSANTLPDLPEPTSCGWFSERDVVEYGDACWNASRAALAASPAGYVVGGYFFTNSRHAEMAYRWGAARPYAVYAQEQILPAASKGSMDLLMLDANRAECIKSVLDLQPLLYLGDERRLYELFESFADADEAVSKALDGRSILDGVTPA